jgi:hypothetical protein
MTGIILNSAVLEKAHCDGYHRKDIPYGPDGSKYETNVNGTA